MGVRARPRQGQRRARRRPRRIGSGETKRSPGHATCPWIVAGERRGRRVETAAGTAPRGSPRGRADRRSPGRPRPPPRRASAGRARRDAPRGTARTRAPCPRRRARSGTKPSAWIVAAEVGSRETPGSQPEHEVAAGLDPDRRRPGTRRSAGRPGPARRAAPGAPARASMASPCRRTSSRGPLGRDRAAGERASAGRPATSASTSASTAAPTLAARSAMRRATASSGRNGASITGASPRRPGSGS